MENVFAAAQATHTDEQRMLLENFRRMAETELAPLADKHEGLGHPPEAAALKELFARVEEFGLISGLIPEADGGALIDRVSYGILYEELARVWPDLAIAVLIQSHAAFTLSLLGNPGQKAMYLDPLLSSERIACTCISEPDVGSNVREVKCRAERQGDKIFVSGQKLWISNGAQSDFSIVVCNLDDGISMVIVDRESGKYESTHHISTIEYTDRPDAAEVSVFRG